MADPTISIYFVKEYKSFIYLFNKKDKTDYILNVTKIVKDKFGSKFIIPNKIQTFLLNYEVRKLLDKALSLNRKNKYKRVIILNANLTKSTLLNLMYFINNEYSNQINLDFNLIKSKSVEDDDIPEDDLLNICII